ncbi:secondary thiamine-phosphate synthase enzyme YjbQ [Oscillochloris sp. ZM17-4]|uniref:secondary thiamine-phosphate synthase enzyme YjbQ n=1 Tax=Oscillochloris sp. ZM17-4 TaxID=2866714 RepID=UPI001C7389AC|nr:secondary thiamine-phosphate synthase enzyme YjbQ [Oscillochloris sp. ZM17-4]MBX0330818.1 secondary thiamine-phosphate synthase enzyme YjbQ [Oscillochloris sp. ZM17-4]
MSVLKRLAIRTHTQECLVDITDQVAQAVTDSGASEGTTLLYVPHTTCGITIQENADPGVQHDMLMVLRRIYPRQDPGYRHIEDNSASHLQASTMGFSHFVFVSGGQLVLGRWQAIYLAEFDGPRTSQGVTFFWGPSQCGKTAHGCVPALLLH